MDAKQSKYIAQLYMEMYDRLMAYARSNLDSESLAEEAVQDTFHIACQKPDALCSSENPQGWLTLTLKFTIRNMKSNRATAKRILEQFLQPRLQEQAYSEDPVDLQMQYGDIAKTKEFQLLAEMAILGRSHEEMAAARGISLVACKKRVQRAKEFLRKKMKHLL